MLFGSYTVNASKPFSSSLGLKFRSGEVNLYACAVKLIDKPLDKVFERRTEVMNDRSDPKLVLQNLKQVPNALICDALLDQG